MKSRWACSPHTIAVGLLLEAMAASDSYDQVRIAGLPDHAIHVAERDAIIAATTAPAPLFRGKLAAVARQHKLDVILLRIGEIADGQMAVAADLALASLPCATWVEHDLALWAEDRSLWLVPDGFGPAVSLSWEGANLEIVPPYGTLAERAAGIDLAAWSLARLLDPATVG